MRYEHLSISEVGKIKGPMSCEKEKKEKTKKKKKKEEEEEEEEEEEQIPAGRPEVSRQAARYPSARVRLLTSL